MISVRIVVFAWGKANFVACVSRWAEIVIVRRKSVSRFIGCAVDNLWRFNYWVEFDLVLSVGRDI